MEELSKRLYSACDRMHDEVTKFYEAVHPDGKPIENEEDLSNLSADLKYYMRLELDYIKELIKEQDADIPLLHRLTLNKSDEQLG